jgi:hypothetical protein
LRNWRALSGGGNSLGAVNEELELTPEEPEELEVEPAGEPEHLTAEPVEPDELELTPG